MHHFLPKMFWCIILGPLNICGKVRCEVFFVYIHFSTLSICYVQNWETAVASNSKQLAKKCACRRAEDANLVLWAQENVMQTFFTQTARGKVNDRWDKWQKINLCPVTLTFTMTLTIFIKWPADQLICRWPVIRRDRKAIISVISGELHPILICCVVYFVNMEAGKRECLLLIGFQGVTFWCKTGTLCFINTT